MTAQEAYDHAFCDLKGRFPEGEEVISQNARFSYCYARDVLKARFPEGEDAISQNTYYSYLYARSVIKDRLPLDWWHNKMVLLSCEDKWAKMYCLEFLK